MKITLSLFFLRGKMHACVFSHFSCIWFFATLWTVACQAPLPMGFSRQELWSGLPCPPPGDLPDPGIELTSLMSPALTGSFFTSIPPWETKGTISSVQFSRSVVSYSLQPHEVQHARPPCPSPTPGVHSDSHPSSQWCHPAVSFSVVYLKWPQLEWQEETNEKIHLNVLTK